MISLAPCQRSPVPRTSSSAFIGYTLTAVPAVLFMAGMFAYPMVDFFVKSFTGAQGVLHHYATVFENPVDRYALATTFKVALLTAVLTALLGYPVALLIASVRPTLANILTLLVLVPFWTSVLVRSYAWIVLLGRRGVLNTSLEAIGVIDQPISLMFNLVGVAVSMVHILLPYMVFPTLSVMTRLNREVVLAAESLGARPWQTFLRVLLPLTLPGIVGGTVLVFTLALGFYITPALLGGPKEIMAAMLIEDRITRHLAWGEASAIALLLLGVTLVAFGICAKMVRQDLLPTVKVEQ